MSISNNKKSMDPADQHPNTLLKGGGVRTTRTSGKLPRQSNKSASRPKSGPKSGPGGAPGRIR